MKKPTPIANAIAAARLIYTADDGAVTDSRLLRIALFAEGQNVNVNPLTLRLVTATDERWPKRRNRTERERNATYVGRVTVPKTGHLFVCLHEVSA